MKKLKITRHSLKKLILPAIIIIQLITIGVLAWFVYFTRTEVKLQSTDKIGSLIARAVEALTLPPPTDAQTGRIYFHEAKLTLPPVSESGHGLYYFYSPAFPGQQAELRLIDKQNVNMQKGKVLATSDMQTVFDIVPKLQACARGYLTLFSPAASGETDGKMVFQKKLTDGRTVYVYLEDACKDNQDQMVPYLKQIDSY
jgi:hypothetical protein